MFVSLLKSIGKFDGFRLGIGKRITAKNAWWLLLVLFFVLIFQLTYYMLLASFWVMYAMCYGIYWCFKTFIQWIIKLVRSRKVKAIENNK